MKFNKYELETIYEALHTEIRELKAERALDIRRGRDIVLINKYIENARKIRDQVSRYFHATDKE